MMTWAGQIWATIELIPARLHLFQKTSLLEDMLNRGIIERVDDIVVFSRTVAEHLSQLRDVRTRLKIASLNLTQSKCHLLKKTGHVAYGKGIETDPEKGRSVCDLQIPLNQKDLKRFLGLASYCRHFVQGFAQKRLVSAPLLVMPHFTQEFILDTYANGEGLGAVLSQVIEGQERVVANASKSHDTVASERPANAERRCLYQQWNDVPGGGLHRRLQLLLPASLVPGVLSGLHNSPVGGHAPRVKRTLEKAPLQLEYSVLRPFERIAMDISGPLPVTERGNCYTLVVGDYFTRWKEAFQKDMDVQTVARILADEFICHMGEIKGETLRAHSSKSCTSCWDQEDQNHPITPTVRWNGETL
eukprot:Em0006g1320a